MEPENGPLEKEIPNLETIISRFQPLIFGGVKVLVSGCGTQFCVLMANLGRNPKIVGKVLRRKTMKDLGLKRDET